MMLLGIATFSKDNITVATFGFMGILIYKLSYNPNFELFERLMGVNNIYEQIIDDDFKLKEWFVVFNLLGVFLGLPIMAYHFMQSRIVEVVIPFLRRNWTTPFLLLVLVLLLSIAISDLTAALIGIIAAIIMFNSNLHIGYIVAIVATANIGNIINVSDIIPYSIVTESGITTRDILIAYIGGMIAFAIFAPIASIFQYKKEPLITPIPNHRIFIEYRHLTAALLIILGTILSTNLISSPAVGVWIGIAISTSFVKANWKAFERTIPCSVFLMLMIFTSGLMPIEEVPEASTLTTFVLGLLSALFNNIPLMKLALLQEGYNLPLLIYAISFGGSLIWFGSVVGIAISNIATESRAVSKWIYYGWYVIVAYTVGFFALYALEQVIG